jgi:hypothetical protein
MADRNGSERSSGRGVNGNNELGSGRSGSDYGNELRSGRGENGKESGSESGNIVRGYGNELSREHMENGGGNQTEFGATEVLNGSSGSRMKGWLFFALEAAVLLCGLLPFVPAGAVAERVMLLVFAPFVVLLGLGMNRLAGLYGARSAVIGGFLVMFVATVSMLTLLGRSGFLVWETALGFVFVIRAGFWLEGSQRASERLRGFFLWECFAVPVLIFVGFGHTADQPLLAAAAVLYLLIRGFSLIYAQRLDGAYGMPGLRGILLLLGIVLALLALLLVFPGAMLAFAAVGAGVFMLLEWLGVDITFTLRTLDQKILPMPAEQGTPDAKDLEALGQSAHIPGVVWLGLAIVVVLLLVAAMYRYRSREKRPEVMANPAIRLVRMKEPAPQRLRYVPAAMGIRQVYQALLRGMEEKGWPAQPAETPREYAARLEKAHPAIRQERDALGELVRQYGEARYGVEPPGRSGAAGAGGGPPERASRLVARLVSAVKPGGRGGKGKD